MNNWAIKPMMTAFGSTKTRLKSSNVKLSPMPSMIINKAKGRKIAVKNLIPLL